MRHADEDVDRDDLAGGEGLHVGGVLRLEAFAEPEVAGGGIVEGVGGCGLREAFDVRCVVGFDERGDCWAAGCAGRC